MTVQGERPLCARPCGPGRHRARRRHGHRLGALQGDPSHAPRRRPAAGACQAWGHVRRDQWRFPEEGQGQGGEEEAPSWPHIHRAQATLHDACGLAISGLKCGSVDRDVVEDVWFCLSGWFLGANLVQFIIYFTQVSLRVLSIAM